MKLYIILFYFLFIIFSFGEDFEIYKVQKGDTLSKICKVHLSNPKQWRELLNYNSIPSPNLIKPGSELKIPASLRKQQTQVEAEPIAKVLDKVGILKIKFLKKEDWNEIEKNQFLNEDDIIRTAESSKAEINFNIEPNSIILLDELSILKVKKDIISTIELKLGGANIKSKHSNMDKTKVKVNTTSSICEVKGEEAEIYSDEKKAKYASYKGKLNVSAQNETVVVPEGYGTVVINGQPPGKPFKILDKVTITPIKKN